MKILLISVLVYISQLDDFDKLDLDIKWKHYKSTYSLRFNEEEEQLRKEIFIKNYQFIEEHNAKNSEFKLKMNKFGHLRSDEVVMNNVMKRTKITQSRDVINIDDLPIRKSIDWRVFGVVSPIQDQLACGCGYAFSGIGAIESHYAIKKGYLPLLSEQEIIDCTDRFGNYGCYGGWAVNVFEFSMSRGLVIRDRWCRSQTPVSEYRVKSIVTIQPSDETRLIRSLSFRGPVSVAMDVHFPVFIFYSSGILNYTGCRKRSLNHAMLTVGFSLTGRAHYIVKNRCTFKSIELGNRMG
ncbi:Digestive cysteine proteinase 3 [Thelohanellus kitauei]|uniref:Digestive cysteine proteinase 3 n=1 Tax=Thelohanellus kitauei TaxID=669202 RepID=A0A0C2JKJ7_THEKT|nr:Digestive cysteine proteinase 3 [Thelohanellus kitauei]